MSLLGQIHNVGRISTHAPQYVKCITYDRLYQQFERPHDVLGNRYRNPVAKMYDRILDTCRKMVRPFARMEIVVRIRPE